MFDSLDVSVSLHQRCSNICLWFEFTRVVSVSLQQRCSNVFFINFTSNITCTYFRSHIYKFIKATILFTFLYFDIYIFCITYYFCIGIHILIAHVFGVKVGLCISFNNVCFAGWVVLLYFWYSPFESAEPIFYWLNGWYFIICVTSIVPWFFYGSHIYINVFLRYHVFVFITIDHFGIIKIWIFKSVWGYFYIYISVL